MKKAGHLAEADLLRPIVIVLLLLNHALAIYSGAWERPDGVGAVEAYWWLGKAVYAVMLESFALVAGWLFAYQIEEGRRFTLWTVAKDKARRLLLPAVVFGLLYLLCFERTAFREWRTLYRLVNGVAHLWFLPMLWWCFVGGFLLWRLRVSEWVKVAALAVLAALSPTVLPLQTGRACYYLLYFYGGFLLVRHRERLAGTPWWQLAAAGVATVATFMAGTLLIRNIDAMAAPGRLDVAWQHVATYMLRMTYAVPGTLLLALLAMKWCARHRLGKANRWLNPLCFGIYVWHQFVIAALYYNTGLPEAVGAELLPWAAAVAAIAVSVPLAWLTHKTKLI